MKDTTARPGESAIVLQLVAAWLFVGIPIAWGVYKTAVNAAALFR
jgi:hypothetical protein